MGPLAVVAAFSALAASTTQASWQKSESNEAAYVHFMRGAWLQLHDEQSAARDEFRYTDRKSVV